jgi:N-acetylglucosaminyldiphosphoundecaprenol N-acetyl-beta-D-mannosaminyltransferase
MSKQTTYAKATVLGVDIDIITIAHATSYILERAADHTAPAGYVVKPYVEFLDQAATDPSLRQILNEAELTLADGVALLWAAHYLYGGQRTFWRFWGSLMAIVLAPTSLQQPLPERFAGINFTWPLLQGAARQGVSVFFIGKETSAEIEASAATVQQQLPELHIAGTYVGRDLVRPRGEVSEAWITDVVATLQHAHPDIILVGMGFPLQERVMSRLAPQLDHGLLIGEGGTFDYEQFGGRRRKAPRLMQRLGLEWLWRLLLEPHRFKRQLAIPRFIRRVWQSR